MLYSLSGSRPAPLPFRIHINGTTRTDSSTFTEAEITAAGFTGPFVEPPYNTSTEQLNWSNGAYTIAALPPAPPPQPDYIGFWDATLTSETYQAAYIYSTTSLPMNSALTAYSAALMNAMNGRVNVGAIQSSIFLVMQAGAGVLTPANLAELQGLMDASNLSSVYTLTPPPAP